MSSLLTSIGKLLNLKFLLITLSILLFLDIYFTFQLKETFWDNYQNHLNLKEIVTIIILYLVTLNIAIPMLAYMLSVLFFLLNLAISFSNIDFIEKILDFIKDTEMQELEEIKERAIKENNSAMMRAYELKLNEYNEIHIIYIFSFFISIETIFFMMNSDNFLNSIIYNVYDYLNLGKTEDTEIIEIFLLYIPIGLLSLFTIRYITSFNLIKIQKWVKSLA